MKLRTIAALMVAISVASTIVDVTAQGFPGRERGRVPRADGPRDREPRREAPAPAQEPFAALERELPSLAVDLALRPDELADWRAFERDVRDIAEMERSRRRHLLSLKDSGEKPATALTLFAALTEDARLRAEAAADLKRHVEALYAKLDDAQRRTFDRRALQSQTEPLGPAGTPREAR